MTAIKLCEKYIRNYLIIGVEGYLKDPKVIDIKIDRDKGDVKK